MFVLLLISMGYNLGVFSYYLDEAYCFLSCS